MADVNNGRIAGALVTSWYASQNWNEITHPEYMDYFTAVLLWLEKGAAIADAGLLKYCKANIEAVTKALAKEEAKDAGIFAGLWNSIRTFFEGAFSAVWKDGRQHLQAALSGGIWDTIKSLTSDKGESLTVFLENCVALGIYDRETAGKISAFAGKNPFTALLSTTTTVLATLYNAITTITGTAGGDFTKTMMARFTPALPGPGDLIQALYIAPEKEEIIRQKLLQNGLSTEDQDLLILSRYRLYDVETIRQLFLRGAIDEAKAVERLQELGFTPTRISEIRKLWEIIPGPQDLLYMVGKEAFEPDQVSKFGLSAEFPEEQSKWLSAQGYTRYWQEKYWFAHWQQPAPGQVLEMLHRRLLTEDDVYQYYRTVEIPPYWRDKLMKISYLPLTRVDARRLYDMGLLTDDELYDNFRDEGYNDAIARKMVQFVQQYSEDNDKDLTKAEILKAYREQIISKLEAIEMLDQIGYTRQQGDFIVALADIQIADDEQKELIKALHDQYIMGLTDLATAKIELLKLSLSEQKITNMLLRWQTDRLQALKLPTKAEIDDWYTAGIITIDQYRYQLQLLNYSAEHIELYVAFITKV